MALLEPDVRTPTVGAPTAPPTRPERPPELRPGRRPRRWPRSAPATIDLRTDADRRAQRRFVAALVLVVIVAAIVRATTLPAALPYQAYVDEGHVIQRSDRMVAGPSWDPGWYRYPSLLPAATGVATAAISVVDPDIRRRAEVADASPYYDIVSPEALLVGRLLVWASSVGTVVVAALLARRLAGRTVALVAAILVAGLPALVSRSAVVIVDTPATFFVMACILATTWIPSPRRRWRAAVVAGACAGLAFATKYTAGAVFAVPVVTVALVPGMRLRRRAGLLAAAVGSAGAAALVAMPALVLRRDSVLLDIQTQARVYADKVSEDSYLRDLVTNVEVGWVVVALGAVGLVLLLRSRVARTTTIGWIAFVALAAVAIGPSSYQPFRNVLPFTPFLCVAAAVTITAVARRIAGARPVTSRTRLRAVTTRRLAVVSAAAIAVVMFAVGAAPKLTTVHETVDEFAALAVDWLATSVAAGDRVLVAEELAIPPWELDRVAGEVVVVPTTGPSPVTDLAGFDFVVTGRWKGGVVDQVPADQLHRLVSFGRSSASAATELWRTNRSAIDISTPTAP